MDISKLFKFNKWAYVNLAKEIRKASWFSAVVLSYTGLTNHAFLMFIFTVVIWIILQISAIVVESFQMDDETDKELSLSKRNPDSKISGEPHEYD